MPPVVSLHPFAATVLAGYLLSDMNFFFAIITEIIRMLLTPPARASQQPGDAPCLGIAKPQILFRDRGSLKSAEDVVKTPAATRPSSGVVQPSGSCWIQQLAHFDVATPQSSRPLAAPETGRERMECCISHCDHRMVGGGVTLWVAK